MPKSGAYNRRVSELGDGIKRLRDATDLAQRDIARAALGDDIDESTIRDFANHISRIETGRETNPSLDTLTRIAKGFRLTVSELFTEIEALNGSARSVTTMRPSASGGELDHSPGHQMVPRTAHDIRPTPGELSTSIGSLGSQMYANTVRIERLEERCADLEQRLLDVTRQQNAATRPRKAGGSKDR